MTSPFRKSHLFQILRSYEASSLPLDVFLSGYFRAHKAIGAKDRKFLADTVYALVRWKGLLDHLSPKPPSWESRYHLYEKNAFLAACEDLSIPLHIRCSFPKELFSLFKTAYGEERAYQLCIASNTPAPTTVRVNPLKTTRDELLTKWQETYCVSPCVFSPLGITFHKKVNFFAMEEFKEGLFEMQDEGSQQIAHLVQAKPKDHILDFCAGSGGKSLAFAPSMQGKGVIYLHDIRSKALEEAKKRLRRAGIQHAQLLHPGDVKKVHLKRTMDWVLVDAPCSGTGTLRRNPDMKWKWRPQALPHLIQEQRQIFEEALSYLKPQGKIVYATCSILPQENEDQIRYFQEKFGLELVDSPFQSFPEKGKMDGFFGAILSF